MLKLYPALALRSAALMVGVVMGAGVVFTASADQQPPAIRIQVEKISLLDLVPTGNSLIAVGERGVIARSKDGGKTWLSQLSPTSRTLTAVSFVNPQIGVAVGHGGTILRTTDGGQKWAVVTVKDIGRDAVLGVTTLKNGNFVAFGAFGMYLVSSDQGQTWQRSSVIEDNFERHISRVMEASDAMYLVGETGVVARSTDGGKVWTPLKTPYAGSFFGILELKDGALLAFGMRGNVYRSDDKGVKWEQVPMSTKATFNGGSVAADGRIVLAGNRGLIAVSKDNGRTFSLMTAPEGMSISQARLLDDGSLTYVGVMATGRLSPEKVTQTGSTISSPIAKRQ